MPKVFWSDRARSVLERLPRDLRREVHVRLRYVRRWPEFYPLVEDNPRWEGHRRFVVARRWTVLYRVVPMLTGAGQQVYVSDIVPSASDY